jgi:fumarate reductase subunit C
VNAAPRGQLEAWLWLAQRASAMVLALAVIVHLGTLITAVQGGLDAAEIVSRLQGHRGWLAFYATFALAAAVHAPLGMRAILREWVRLGPTATDLVSAALAAGLLLLGLRAAVAMYLGPG